MPPPDLLTIGQFSRMTRLSIKALRLYDSRDILNPAHIDSQTGYRYYHFSQLRRAGLIKTLRAVDMPLDEIKLVLASEDNSETLQSLLSHKSRLQERLADQERMLSHLETIIRAEEQAMPLEVTINAVDKQTVASLKVHTSLETIKNDIPRGFARFGQLIEAGGMQPLGAPLLVYHDVIDQESDGDVEICFPTSADFKGADGIAVRELEAGQMATAIHTGPYENITPLYHKLVEWIHEHGYQIVGPPREIYENDPRMVAPPELRTRVEFPVAQSDQVAGRE